MTVFKVVNLDNLTQEDLSNFKSIEINFINNKDKEMIKYKRRIIETQETENFDGQLIDLKKVFKDMDKRYHHLLLVALE